MKKIALILSGICIFTYTNSSFGMSNDTNQQSQNVTNLNQSEKIPRKRKDKQLQELIQVQKTTNLLLLFQIKQDRLLAQQQMALMMQESTHSKRLRTADKLDVQIDNLYQEYGAVIKSFKSSRENLK